MCNHPKSLKISKIHIDFRSDKENPQATFTVGKDFSDKKIKLIKIKQCTETDPQTAHVHCLHNKKTDCHGNFTISVLNDLETIKVTVITSCIKSSEEFHLYTPDELVCRTFTGTGNNIFNPMWGSVNECLLRQHATKSKHANKSLGDSLPNPRWVSNAICAQTQSVPNKRGLTDIVWGWGQFLDHEIDLTPDSGEQMNIATSSEDPYEQYPGRIIPFTRSIYEIDQNGNRQQINKLSSFIDATNVYGYDTYRAYAIRSLDGSGKIKMTDNNLLINNSKGFPNANPTHVPLDVQFLSGDIRANETFQLISFHTLFTREHNRLCDEVLNEKPEWSGMDEMIYQEARRRVCGIMQNITFTEFLPALGITLPTYTGYKSSVNPGIKNEFSTSAYRFGHSMLSPNMKIINDNNTTYFPLKNTFFNPGWIRQNGIDGILLGASKQVMQEIDHRIVDAVRNFLFESPTATMMHDLVALNIQRGRDHQLPSYNEMRAAYGLPIKQKWNDITSDATLINRLTTLYGETPDNLDPWLGGLLEKHVNGCAVGELIKTVLTEQFTRLRDCDQFYFENDNALSNSTKNSIRLTKLSDVINRNTNVTVQKNVFFANHNQ
jgi:hypothetical protein